MRHIFGKEYEPPHPLSKARNYHINWRGKRKKYPPLLLQKN
jgi:hypothetical protein